MTTIEFKHGDKDYVANGEIVDTDYGPENKVEVWCGTKKKVMTFQECMSTPMVVTMFKEVMDELHECENESTELNVEDYHCLTCGKPHGGDPLTTEFCSTDCRNKWTAENCCPVDDLEETPRLDPPPWSYK